MKLIRIEMENFKSVGRRQEVEIRPVTLLFGHNNAGKSAVLQALAYQRDILKQGRADLKVTTDGGVLDHGSFSNLVHGRELDRAIILKSVFDVRQSRTSFLPVYSQREVIGGTEAKEVDIRYLRGIGNDEVTRDPPPGVESVAVETEISWNSEWHRAFVSRLTLDMNGKPIVEITASKNGASQLLKIYFDHELNRHPDGEGLESPFERRVWQLAEKAASQLPKPKERSFGPGDGIRVFADYLCLTVETKGDAMPPFERRLNVQFRTLDDLTGSERKPAGEPVFDRVVHGLLTEQIFGSLLVAKESLSAMKHFGAAPGNLPKEFGFRKFAAAKCREDGWEAWDLNFQETDCALIDEVNRWLSDKDKLNVGCRFDREVFEEIPVSRGAENVREEAPGNRTASDTSSSISADNPLRVRVGLYDCVHDIRVPPGNSVLA